MDIGKKVIERNELEVIGKEVFGLSKKILKNAKYVLLDEAYALNYGDTGLLLVFHDKYCTLMLKRDLYAPDVTVLMRYDDLSKLLEKVKP